MSMLAAQSDELREMAAAMSERGGAIGLDYGMGLGLVDAARMMREAADTITSLSDKLQGVMGTRYSELFGTPERAARTITRMQMATDLMGCCDADTCPAAFNECWKLDACPMDDYDALLEWLSGDAE